jgi:hypothetical protein
VNEETKSKDKRVIPLNRKQYEDLKRALQWPEDLEKYDKLAKPTPLTEIPI